MAYEIRLQGGAAAELRGLGVYERRRIVDEINKQLSHQPTVATRNRKCLLGLTPGFEHRPPIWELRIDDIRVFYDVDEESQQVHVRAIRRKGRGQTTEDIT